MDLNRSVHSFWRRRRCLLHNQPSLSSSMMISEERKSSFSFLRRYDVMCYCMRTGQFCPVLRERWHIALPDTWRKRCYHSRRFVSSIIVDFCRRFTSMSTSFVERVTFLFLFWINYQNDVARVTEQQVCQSIWESSGSLADDWQTHLSFAIVLGESTVTVDRLRELCSQMESPAVERRKADVRVNIVEHLVLPFPSVPSITRIQEKDKTGLFIGSKGMHIRRIEEQFQVRIHIVNTSSKKSLKRTVYRLKENGNKEWTVANLCVLLTSTRNETDQFSQYQVNQAKAALQMRWTTIPLPKARHLDKCSNPSISSSLNFTQDSRWKPKNRKAHERKMRKQDQCIKLEPQTTFVALPMPQPMHKSRRHRARWNSRTSLKTIEAQRSP